MTKLLQISHCGQCPHRGDDANRTRQLCKHRFPYRMLHWNDEDEDAPDLPDWCPLPDAPVNVDLIQVGNEEKIEENDSNGLKSE